MTFARAKPLSKPRRLGDTLIVHGHAKRDKYDVGIVGDDVWISGTLWDRMGPALSFGYNELRFHTRVAVDCGVLPEDFDGNWTRDRT